jgi:hypothetical protein
VRGRRRLSLYALANRCPASARVPRGKQVKDAPRVACWPKRGCEPKASVLPASVRERGRTPTCAAQRRPGREEARGSSRPRSSSRSPRPEAPSRPRRSRSGFSQRVGEAQPDSRVGRARWPREVRRMLWAALATCIVCVSLGACGGASHTVSQDAAAPRPRSLPTTTPASIPPSAGTAPRPSTSPNTSNVPHSARSYAPARVRAAITQLRTCMRLHGAPISTPGGRGAAGNRTRVSGGRLKAAVAACRPALIAALRSTSAGGPTR